MALSEERRKQLEALAGSAAAPTPSAPAPTTPMAPVASGLSMQGMILKTPQGSVRYAPTKQPAPTKKRVVPQGQLTVLESTNRAISRLEKLLQTQKEKQFKTGPLSPRFYRGTAGNIAMQYVGSPEERTFKAENERFMNDYVTAQTGAQRGFKEMAWLQTAIPNPAQDTPENYVANGESALRDLKENRQMILKLLESSGYQVPDVEESSTLSPKAQSLIDRYKGR